MKIKKNIIAKSINDTKKIAVEFAKKLSQGDIVLFYGDIGVGKTEFIKAICNYFNVVQIVTSPTFTIVNQYEGNRGTEILNIFHIDLYRITKKDELITIGFEDYIYSEKALKFVEWAENSFDFINNYNYSVKIIANNQNENLRHIEIIKFDAEK